MRRASRVILVAALADTLADHCTVGEEDAATESKAATDLCIATDIADMGGAGVPWARGMAEGRFSIAEAAADADFGMVCSETPQSHVESARMDGVSGVDHKATWVGQGFAKQVAQASLSATQSGLSLVGAGAGKLLRLAIGNESADTLIAVRKIVCDFAAPMAYADAPPLPELWQAARAWGALQHAAATQATICDSPDMVREAFLPGDVERLLRFTAATSGHVDGTAGRVRARLAIARGDGPAEAAIASAGLKGQIEVLAFEQKSAEVFAPGFLVAVDHDTAKVIVALRGTSSVADALTDLACEPVPVQLAGHSGMAHGGMLRAARKLQGALAELVDKGLARLGADTQQRVVISGYSLGAGVAALVAALWRDAGRFPGSLIECFAFACPQVLDHDLALAQSNHTTSVIVGNDIVPRASMATAKDLRTAMLLLSSGSSEAGLRTADILAAQAQGDVQALASAYKVLRAEVCTSSNRLYPSGRLIHLQPGQQARLVGHETVDELFIAGDMVSAHLLPSYLPAIQEAAAAACFPRSQSPDRTVFYDCLE